MFHILGYFYVKTQTLLLKKVPPSFLANPLGPLFFENLVGGSTFPAEVGCPHYVFIELYIALSEGGSRGNIES